MKYVRSKRAKGPKGGPTKLKMTKAETEKLKPSAKMTKTSEKKVKPKGETSFIIEDMMQQALAKGDITMSDGTGTDNMTCIIVQFRDPNET